MKFDKIENSSGKTEFVWNLLGFSAIAVGGILLNLALARLFGAKGTGVFNQVFAFFILYGQIATFGVQWATLHFVASHREDEKKISHILQAALIRALVTSLILMVFAAFLTPVIGWLFNSLDVQKGYLIVLPGIVFFGFNKILLNALNSMGRYRSFAIGRALRFIFMFLMVVILFYAKQAVWMLPIVLVASEIATFFILVLFLRKELFVVWNRQELRNWLPQVGQFGRHSFMGGAVAAVNTRVDILILGMFLNDAMVGIYSMAALFAEGLMELANVTRFIVNPRLARLYKNDTKQNIREFLLKWRNITMFLVGVVALLSIALFPVVIDILVSDKAFLEGWASFIILAIGISLVSGYRALDMIMNQLGEPWQQTLYRIKIFSINIVGNILLIPFFGINGAALGTAISFFIGAIILRRTIAKRYDILI